MLPTSKPLHSSTFFVFITLILSSCTHVEKPQVGYSLGKPSSYGGAPSLEDAARSLLDGTGENAVSIFESHLARSPRDPIYHTLLGYSHLLASEKTPGSEELAREGFASALRADPLSYWPAKLDGQIAFEKGLYSEAAERFATAVLAAPKDVRAFIDLAAASYMSGDIVVAQIASERALELNASHDERKMALRLSALSSAAMGENKRARLRQHQFANLDAKKAPALNNRINYLVATSKLAALEGNIDNAERPDPVKDLNDNDNDLPQVAVDVTILLSQNTHQNTIGLNLLDGLNLQFGREDTRTSTILSDGGRSSERSIINTITLPTLSYNLNIFNHSGQYYQVVARPSLVASLREPSEFFVGRSLKVAVTGEDIAELIDVDIGVGLNIEPIVISDEGTRVRIEANRSFLTNDIPGTFSQSLSTFVQKVHATATIKFGETLVLSGLSESVQDTAMSKTPLLGDLPIISLGFKQKTKDSRRDAVIVLVTPNRPLSISSEPWARPKAVVKLAKLWSTIIDPSTNGLDVATRLGNTRMFRQMSANDAPLSRQSRTQQTKALIADLINQ